jgi:hypothetical protein
MGIYNFPIKEREISYEKVLIDGESYIARFMNKSRLEASDEARHNLPPNSILVFSGKGYVGSFTDLKYKKTILKLFLNQDPVQMTRNIKDYLWRYFLDYIHLNPPQETNIMFLIKLSIDNHINIINEKNRINIFKAIADYVWKKGEMHKAFVNLFIHRKLFNPGHYSPDFIQVLSVIHKKKKTTPRRLKKYIETFQRELFLWNIPFIIAPGDADEFIIRWHFLWDAVYTTDTDMMVIPDTKIITRKGMGIKTKNFHKKNPENILNACKLASADYNYYLFEFRISFKEALFAIRRFHGDYYQAFEFLCKRYGKPYRRDIAEDIHRAYQLDNSVKIVKESVKTIYNYVDDLTRQILDIFIRNEVYDFIAIKNIIKLLPKIRRVLEKEVHSQSPCPSLRNEPSCTVEG